MKRTIVQTQCDVCSRPAIPAYEVAVRPPSNRAKTYDLCGKHFRQIAKVLKFSTDTPHADTQATPDTIDPEPAEG